MKINNAKFRKFLSKWETKLENTGLINVTISSTNGGFEFVYDSFDNSNPASKIIKRNIDEFSEGVKLKIFQDFIDLFPKGDLQELTPELVPNENLSEYKKLIGKQIGMSTNGDEEYLINVLNVYLIDEMLGEDSEIGLVYNTETNLEEQEEVIEKAVFDFLIEEGETNYINQNNFQDVVLRYDMGNVNDSNNSVVGKLGKIADNFDVLNKVDLEKEQQNDLVFDYVDNWGRSVYLTKSGGMKFVNVDGVLHEMTDAGEPLIPRYDLVVPEPLHDSENPGGYGMIQGQETDPDQDQELFAFCSRKNIFVFYGGRGKNEENYSPDHYSFIGKIDYLRQMLEKFCGYTKSQIDTIEYFDVNSIVGVTEQVTTEPDETDLLEFVNTHNITMEFIEDSVMGKAYKYSGLVIDLMQMLKEHWGNDPDLLGTVEFDQN